ncbi:hypothetical protein INT44_004826 [Umbelopsis vinacea]|uniref:Uncharacterized protein n=1 Tax=Umbelopsis vinacea TaxID=44442 RepID=A0A8H7Q9B6_9FUNG|nr:hypothetical protein INT44_004826 [Umbelopsis vinacea]
MFLFSHFNHYRQLTPAHSWTLDIGDDYTVLHDLHTVGKLFLPRISEVGHMVAEQCLLTGSNILGNPPKSNLPIPYARSTLMRETTEEDVTKEIKWEHRHVRLSDTWRSLKISKPLCELVNVGIIVQALHVDLTTQLEVMGEELLPSYNESVPQTTIHIHDSRLPHYDDLVAHEDIDLADFTRPSYLSSPLASMTLPEYRPAAPQTR